ncbi:TetR/AcrR family transcriptional regulator [Actinoplanes sp. NPDC024001]|uniref:TetR/AcrR family transcriptional regulator n=1 Tax=Actinoplanes sp. NPDC024001 TaxID=3154598 RepID=UPI0033F16AE7
MTEVESKQLRRTIVRAALPLMAELHSLTTAQIAAAAGVGEADLLAVFADREAVEQACFASLVDDVGAAVDSAEELRRVAEIRADQPLAARLAEVIDIIDAYYRRVRRNLADLYAGFGTAEAHRSGRQEDLGSFGGVPEFRQAVARLLEPHAPQLRFPADALAEAFIALIVSRARPDRSPLPATQIVDLFLRGALDARTPGLRRPQRP